MIVIYEDNDILVIDKPAGLVVHPDKNHPNHTLVDELIKYCPTIKEAVVDPKDPISRQRAGIVHRLDKDTSGLLVVAKNRQSLLNLQKSFQEGKVNKCYTTLLFGKLENNQIVETKITRSHKNKRAMMISRDENGRLAISIFKPKQYFNFYSQDITLAEVEIKTGRTHQIRLQAASINHPVIGDQMYNSKLSKKLSQKLNIKRQLLHASSLSFPHPKTKQKMNFQSELPLDFQQLIEKIYLCRPSQVDDSAEEGSSEPLSA